MQGSLSVIPCEELMANTSSNIMKSFIIFTFVVVSNLAANSVALAIELRFDGWPDLDSHLDTVIPIYEANAVGTKVSYQMNGHGDHHKKLTTNLATGNGAGDVVAVDVGFIGAFINQGGFENLSDAPYHANELADQFVGYAWEQGRGTDGNQYAIPYDIGPGVMYYRRDALKLVSGDISAVISDWDSYIAYGRELKEKDIFLIADAGDIAKTIIHTTVEEGNGYYFDSDGNSLITSDRFVTAFEVAKQVRDEGLDAQISAWTNEWYDSFKQGTVATQLSGAWLIGHLQNWMAPETAGKWGVSNLPDGIFGSWGGGFLAIPKQVENKAAAWAFIQYLTLNEEAQLSALKEIGAFPVLKASYNDEAFDEPIDFLAGQRARQLFAQVAENVTPVKPRKGDLIAEDVVLAGALREVLDEDKDILQALQEAERLIKRRVR